MSAQNPLTAERWHKGTPFDRDGILDQLNTELNERSEYTKRFTYDFADDGGAISAITLGSLPAGAKIIEAYYGVATTLVSATDAATVELGTGSDPNGFVTAVAISVGTTWDAELAVATIVDGVANGIEGSSEDIDLTIAVEALTAGRLHLWVKYVVSA